MIKRAFLLSPIFVFIYLFGFLASVYAVDPHLELSPSTGLITTDGTSIEVKIVSAGQAVKSAKAVVNFDSALLEVSSIQAGDFFDDVSHNIYNSSGQVVINASLSVDSLLESKTGSGALGTMTVKAKTASGTANMAFDCTVGSSTDSNINDPDLTDIIVCTSNIDGSYDLTGGVSATPAATPTPSPAVGGDTATISAEIPVTGTAGPTLFLFLGGLVLLLAPVFLKIL